MLRDSAKQGIDKKNLEGVEKHANSLMENGIKQVAKELVDECYKGQDGGQKNEPEIEVRIALKKIANRVDQGVNVEIRMAAPTTPDTDESGEQDADVDMKAYELIQNASPTLQFLKLEGDPILSLPESEADKSKKK